MLRRPSFASSVRRDRRGKSLARDLVEILGLAVFLSILLRIYVVQAFYIPSGSMEDTLLVNDMLLINKLALSFGEPSRGDILVFKCPTPEPYTEAKDFIKRVVGLPGDKLEIRDGRLVRNGEPVDEPYLKEPMDETRIFHAHKRFDPESGQVASFAASDSVTVPPGHLFMMGDNRNNSQDSRYWGMLPRKAVIGRAAFRYWPPSRIGLIR